MAGYLGSKAAFLSTTTANVTGDSTIGGNIIVGGTVDGRDIAADGVLIDGLNALTTTQNFYSGDDSTVNFTLPYAPVGVNGISVYVDGVHQDNNSISTTGTALIFAEAPPTGTDNIVVRMVATGVTNFTTATNVVAKKEYATVALLLADTTDGTFFNTGDYVTVVEGGFSYKVATVGAVTNAGGIQFDVLASDDGSVNVKAFGAVGDGVTDDTVAIQAALTAGTTVTLAHGTYRVDGSLVLTANNHLVDGTLDRSNGASGVPCVTALGTLETAVAPSANITKGDTVITVVGTTFSEHDWVILYDTVSYDASNTNQENGEMVQVKSSTGTTVTLMAGTEQAYTTAASAGMQKVNLVDNIGLSNIAIIGSGVDDNGQQGFQPFFCSNVFIDGCRFSNLTNHAIQMVSCIHSKVMNSHFSSTVVDAGTGYGVSFSDCTQDCVASGNTFQYLRHSLSTNNKTGYYGVPRRILFSDNVITNSAPALGGSGGDAIDTHGAADQIHIVNNTVYGSSGNGINVECSGGSIVGNKIYNCAVNGIGYHNESDHVGKMLISGNTVVGSTGSAIDVDQGFRGTTTLLSYVTVSNNICHDSGADAITITTTGALRPTNISIVDNEIVGCATGILVQATDYITISGNKISGTTDQSMDIRTCTNLVISNNTIYSANAGAFDVLYLLDCTGGRVSDNSITVAAGSAQAIDIRGTSSQFVVSNNLIRSDQTGTLLQLWPGATTPEFRGVVSGNNIMGLTGTTTSKAIHLVNTPEYTLVSSNVVRNTGGVDMGTGAGNVEVNTLV